MSRVEELVDNNTKEELIEMANRLGVSDDGNKPDIAERIAAAESDEVSGATVEPDEAQLDEPADAATGPVAYEVSDAATAPSTANDTISLPNVGEDEAQGANDEESQQSDEEETQQAAEEEMVLVKMDRTNASFTIGSGYTFTRDHPYLPLPRSVAEHVMNNVGGFRPATEQEVQLYYDR